MFPAVKWLTMTPSHITKFLCQGVFVPFIHPMSWGPLAHVEQIDTWLKLLSGQTNYFFLCEHCILLQLKSLLFWLQVLRRFNRHFICFESKIRSDIFDVTQFYLNSRYIYHLLYTHTPSLLSSHVCPQFFTEN